MSANAPARNDTTSTPQTWAAKTTSQPPSDIDLSTLTPDDLLTLRPLLDALGPLRTTRNHSASGEEGEEEDEEEQEGDLESMTDEKILELMEQMDIAGQVADDLEGKLDIFLAQLEGLDEEIRAQAVVDTRGDESEDTEVEEKTGGLVDETRVD